MQDNFNRTLLSRRKGRLHRFLVVSYECIARLLFSLPRFAVFNSLKAAFLRLRGAKVGRGTIFYPGVWIAPGSGLIVGEDVDFALDVIVTTGGGVEIGDRTLIGYRTMIFSANHTIPVAPGRIFESGHQKATVRIAQDVWIGAACVILPGVSIGEGAVVAAGSVVSRDVEPFAIVAGVPARLIRKRDGAGGVV